MPRITESPHWDAENFAESPFLLPQRGDEAAPEGEAAWHVAAETTTAFGGESPANAAAVPVGTPQGSPEPDPYMAIRPALSPAHANLTADEIVIGFGRLPAVLTLHQVLASPVPQQAALAVLLGRAGRRALHLDGSEVSIPSYLRVLSRLCREAAEEAEAYAEQGRTEAEGSVSGVIPTAYTEVGHPQSLFLPRSGPIGAVPPAPAPPPPAPVIAGAAGRQDGIDVYEQNALPSFNAMKGIRIEFIFHKSSERLPNGLLYNDRLFSRRWAETRAAGIIRGSFHYYRHKNGASGDEQADRVVNQVERLLPGDLAPSLDFETDAVSASNSEPTAREWRMELEAFLDRIEVGLGRTPFVYTSERAWREHISGKTDFRLADFAHFAEYPLWVKEYLFDPIIDGTNTDNKPSPITSAFVSAAHRIATRRYNARDRGMPVLPAPWTRFQVWQYSQYTPASLDGQPFRDIEIDYDVTKGGLYVLRGFADLGRTAPHVVGNLSCIAYAEADGKIYLLEFLNGTWRNAGDVLTAAKAPSLATGDPAAIGLGSEQVIVYRGQDSLVYTLTRSLVGPGDTWSVARISDDEAQDDPWIAAIGDDLHVVFWGRLDRQAHLVRTGGVWHADDIAVPAAVPGASGSAAAYAHMGAFHIVSRGGRDGHLFDLHRLGPAARRDDLMALARDGNGNPPPAATYRPAVLLRPDRPPEIVFRALRGAIWTIERDTLRARNLSAVAVKAKGDGAGTAAAPNAAGSPTAVTCGVSRVFYRAVDNYHAVGGMVIEIFEDGAAVRWREVCAGAAADPTAFVDDQGCKVVFRAEDGSIRLARLANGEWTCEAVTVTVSPTRPAGTSTGVLGGAAEMEAPLAAAVPIMEAQVGNPPPSPFPTRFVEPHASSLAGRNKMIAAFHTAIQAAATDPAYSGLPGIDTLPIAIVALDTDGSRPLAGQRHFEMYYSASLLKVAAMYAAFQLRAAANDLAAPLDPAVVSERELFKRLTDIFDAQINGAVPRINNHKPPISLAMRVPKYRDIFAAAADHGHWRLDFNAAFDGNLSAMIVDSDDIAAGACIRALGYSWIDGVLQSAGFFDDSLPGTEGIWLAGDYNRWPTVDIASLNDGLVKQATTCFHMAWLFVRLFDNGLVDDAAHHFAGNADMQHLLTLAVDSHGAPSLLKRAFGPGDPPFHVLQTKIGVGELKGGDCRDPDAAGRERRDRCVYSEASIVQHPASGRKFVTMWQNLTFLKAHPDWWELGLRRICGVIRKTMENYHP